MQSFRSLAAAAVVCLLLAGCSLAGDDDDLALDDREFWSTTVVRDGEPLALVSETRIAITFAEEQLQANAGCNQIAGGFDIEGDLLVTKDVSWTERGCDPDRHAQDEMLIGLLTSEPVIALVGDELELSNSDLVVRLVDSTVLNPDRSLTGTMWEVDGYLRGQTAMSITTTRRASLVLGPDGTVTGTDGCYLLQGQASIDEDQVDFRLEPIDEGACRNQSYVDEFYASLQTTVMWAVAGDKLTLTDARGVGLTAFASQG